MLCRFPTFHAEWVAEGFFTNHIAMVELVIPAKPPGIGLVSHPYDSYCLQLPKP